MSAKDEQMTVRTVMDLQHYSRKEATALFRQRLEPGHEGSFHSFAMAVSDWVALGRPSSITMTLAAETET